MLLPRRGVKSVPCVLNSTADWLPCMHSVCVNCNLHVTKERIAVWPDKFAWRTENSLQGHLLIWMFYGFQYGMIITFIACFLPKKAIVTVIFVMCPCVHLPVCKIVWITFSLSTEWVPTDSSRNKKHICTKMCGRCFKVSLFHFVVCHSLRYCHAIKKYLAQYVAWKVKFKRWNDHKLAFLHVKEKGSSSHTILVHVLLQ